ncbi:hypothetical protein BJ170DRAFT_624244 [Xylariales sp. AK1849]|nr:hypothetical protein BJ170DRAFT_624244 [Xylariales sp. AK1849]
MRYLRTWSMALLQGCGQCTHLATMIEPRRRHCFGLIQHTVRLTLDKSLNPATVRGRREGGVEWYFESCSLVVGCRCVVDSHDGVWSASCDSDRTVPAAHWRSSRLSGV